MSEPKPSFLRETFTWRTTREITRHGARFLTALAVAVLAPVCYVVGWGYLPYGLWRRARDRRRHAGEELAAFYECPTCHHANPKLTSVEYGQMLFVKCERCGLGFTPAGGADSSEQVK